MNTYLKINFYQYIKIRKCVIIRKDFYMKLKMLDAFAFLYKYYARCEIAVKALNLI